MVDRFTKVVLTVIAGALVWLCLWGPGPNWGTPAEAQYSRAVDVNIQEVGGRRLDTHSPKIPVVVEGDVEVRGMYGAFTEARRARLKELAGPQPLDVRVTNWADGRSLAWPVEVKGAVTVVQR